MANAKDLMGLTEIGRATVGGREYVAYDDGAYTSVVDAADWDADLDPDDYAPGNDESGCNHYDRWCQRVSIVSDDRILQAVANAVGRNVYDGASFVEPDDND